MSKWHQTACGALNTLPFHFETRAFVKTVIVRACLSSLPLWVEPEVGQMQIVLISTTGIDFKGDTVLSNVADAL